MPLPSYYATGSASVTNGTTTITFASAGLGSAEFPTVQAGDLFLDPAQPEIPPQRIASIDYDAEEAELFAPWPGTTMTADPYEIRFVGDIVRSTAQTRLLLERLQNTYGLTPDAIVAELADRDAFDDEDEGFIVLVADVGDGRAAFYAMGPGGSADWSDPIYVAGPVGPSGLIGLWRGAYSGATAYDENDVVLQNGSSWIALQSTTGNAPPTLPTTANTYWQLVSAKGDTGSIGGSTGSTDNRLLRSDGTGGATAQASAVTVDDSGNMSTPGNFTSLVGLVVNRGAAAGLMEGRRSDTPTGPRTMGYIDFEDRDTDGTLYDAGIRFQAELTDATPATFSMELRVGVRRSGSGGERLRIGSGLYHASTTGGDKGNNTINFGAVYDDNTLLTCMAMSEEFIERGEIDLAKWDALVPDQIVPEQREEVAVVWPVQVVERVPVIEPDEQGRLVRRIETVERTVEVQAVIADPVYDADDEIVDAVETPLFDEVVHPEQVIVREHRTARVFKAMIDSGFDPRDPEQYFAKMRADEALPGMPNQLDWEHNGLSIGEQHSRQWLATEMLAIVCNVMWGKLQDHEARIAALEHTSRRQATDPHLQ